MLNFWEETEKIKYNRAHYASTSWSQWHTEVREENEKTDEGEKFRSHC